MLNGAITLGVILVGAYILIGIVRMILRSKALIVSAIYFGGYAYYNKEWPSLDTTISSLMSLFHIM